MSRPPYIFNKRRGATVPDWALITGWGSLNDAGPYTTTGTGQSSGTITLAMAGDIVQVDGWRESWSGYDVPLLDLYPDWDDTTDRLDLLLEIASMPLTTAKYGWWFGVVDAVYASRATANGAGLTVYPNSTTVTQTSQSGATANGSAANNGTNTNAVTQVFGSFSWDSAGVPRVTGTTKRTTDQGTIQIAGAVPTAMGAAANRRICLGHVHVSTTTGAPVLSGRLYHRRIRTTSPFI